MSLISTYQSRKSLFAEKLITKGVEASATDGLTTLINKIGDISTCNNGLLFAVDKTIAQSGGTVNLSAMILKDGVFQVGETVNFYTGDVRTLGDTVSQIDLGGNAWKLSIETFDTLVQFGQSDEVNITRTNDGYNITDAYQQHTYDLEGDYVCFDGTNLVLYNDVDSCDISDFEDIDTWESNIINKIYYYPYPPATVHIEVLLTAVTGSNGVASVQYSCSGSGLKNFYATSGSLVSEPSSVLDCTAIDYGTDLKHNDSIWNAVNRLSRGLEYTTFTHTSLAQVYNSISGDVCIEFDASASMLNNSALFSVRTDSTSLLQATRSQLQMQENTFYHIKVEIKNNTATITNIDTNQSVTGDVTGATRFYLRISADETILFKNYMIYPI